MKNKCTRILSLLLIAAISVFVLTGCSVTDKLSIGKTLNRFEKACRAADVDGMLDCINPSIVNPVRNTLALFGIGSLNDSLDAVLELLGSFDFKGENASEIIKTIKISPKSYEFSTDGEDCDVFTEISYVVNGSDVRNTYIIRCEKVGSDWFIMGIS